MTARAGAEEHAPQFAWQVVPCDLCRRVSPLSEGVKLCGAARSDGYQVQPEYIPVTVVVDVAHAVMPVVTELSQSPAKVPPVVMAQE